MVRKRRHAESSSLLRVVGIAQRHPWRTICVWALTLGVMGIVGLDVANVLRGAGEASITGAPATRALALERAKFGTSESLAVVLRGPQRDLERYGPRVARAVDRVGHVDVMSPWSPGAPAALSPRRGASLMLLRVTAPYNEAGTKVTPEARRALDRNLPRSITAHLTGVSSIAAYIHEEAVAGVLNAERIAVPFLAVILLLIFRSPIAAALPLVLGVSVITIGKGILTAAGHLIPINEAGLSTVSIIGLALGVDYSLLMVSRFRDELARHGSTATAVRVATMSAGRSVAFAGAIVAIGVTIGGFIIFEPELGSASAGLALACTLSVAATLTLLPAMLTLFGSRIDTWRIGRRSARPVLAPLVTRIIRRPIAVGVAALLPLLVLAVPALGLKTGPAHPTEFGTDNREVRAMNALQRVAGSGWGVPYSVLVSSVSGPITTPRVLSALARFQDRLATDPAVAAVIGPRALASGSRDLRRAALGFDRLARLDRGLARARRGLLRLQDGLARTVHGSGALAVAATRALLGGSALDAGTGQAAAGAAALDEGLGQTRAGAARLQGTIARVQSGAQKLAEAAESARTGARSVGDAAWTFGESLDGSLDELSALAEAPAQAQSQAEKAKDSLAAATLASKSDPRVQRAIESAATAVATLSGINPLTAEQIRGDYQGIGAALERARTASSVAAKQAGDLLSLAKTLAAAASALNDGDRNLASGARKSIASARALARSLDDATADGSRIDTAAGQLRGDAGGLTDALGGSPADADALHAELASTASASGELRRGLDRVASEVAETGARVDQASRGTGLDPSLAVGSGYMTLAALDGMTPAQRRDANLVVNADRGGDTARLFVMLNRDPTAEAADRFPERLARATRSLGNEAGAKVSIGGRAATLDDYDRLTQARRVPLIAALSLVTLVFLVVVFRSLLLAVKAVVLNLLVVGAAFGVTALMVSGPHPVLPGPGWMDAIAFFIVYVTVFTLSMDYEIFMINRMREGYLATGSNDRAIHAGIQGTARVITGAASIMIVVFAAFALFGGGLIQQLGLALSVAVFVDATLVRLILLPATMRLFGKANWWLPGWLDRLLPKLDLEGKGNAHQT